MDKQTTEAIESAIDYEFNNKHLLQQAFIRRSYSKEEGGENNEVLEFIGDKALDFVVMKVIMKRFGHITSGEYNEFKTKYDEGKFTEIKKELVESKMLAKCIDNLGFNQYLIMGRGDCKNNVQDEDSVKEDLFEAIVGAVTIDSDWDFDVIEDVVKMMIDFNSFFNNDENEIEYVAEIQKWSQKHYDELPNYRFDDTYDGYRCTLYLNGVNRNFYGEGKSKSGARFLAAKEAYEYLDYNDMLFSLEDEIGEPDEDRAINQLQELYQKGYIPEPIYDVYENEEVESNDDYWCCDAYLDGMDQNDASCFVASSKKQAKKEAAYDLLVRVMNDEVDYINDYDEWEDEWDND